ncbi:MAG: oligosaccharide flippase family protein [Candidatus Cloacimonetes bacterium]|nr:oligosaccharide flippase family protein [Candidatus Cloacimonadota bacterium]
MNRRTLRKISYRIFGTFYGRGIVFFATAYVSRVVGPESFGYLSIILSMYSVFLILGGNQLSRAVATYSAQEPERKRMHYWHGLGFMLACYLVTMLAFYSFMLIVRPIEDAAIQRIALIYMPFLLFFLLTELFKGTLLGSGRVGLLTIMEAIQGTLKAGLVALFIYLSGFSGWMWGRISGEALAYIVLFLMMIAVFRKDFAGQTLRLERPLLKRYVGYYGWSFLGGGLAQIQMQLQPFLVLWFVQSSSEVAFIKIALLYLTSLSLLAPSITTALYADVARKHKDRDGLLRHMRKVLALTTGAFIIVLAGLWLLAPVLIDLLHGSAYSAVVPLFRVMLIAALFQHISSINGGYWLAIGNVRLNSIVSLVSFIVFLAVSIPMCWFWSTWGMALAVLVTRIFNSVLNTWVSYRWMVPMSSSAAEAAE